MDNYEKIDPDSAMGKIVYRANQEGIFACDAVDHNSNQGCPNLKCFRHLPPKT